MIPILDLFEAHLNVRDLSRSMTFFGDTLGLQLAQLYRERKVAFYWIGKPGQAMLGIWEMPHHFPLQNAHVAFRVAFSDLMQAPAGLSEVNIVPRDFEDKATTEPVVLAWMPAAALYFRDPDGNLLEFLSMLPDLPRPDLGVVSWSQWIQRAEVAEKEDKTLRFHERFSNLEETEETEK